MIARKRFRDLSYFYVAKSARARILEKIRAPQISVSQLNAEAKRRKRFAGPFLNPSHAISVGKFEIHENASF